MRVGCSQIEHISVHNNLHTIQQLDGNISLNSSGFESISDSTNIINVHVSLVRKKPVVNTEPRTRVLKSIKRNNSVLHALELPLVINLNPRSLYNKLDEFKLMMEQYQADVVFVSESWERENLTLMDVIDVENFEIISTVKRRNFTGGNPVIIINSKKYHIEKICPEPITVPVGVEAIWGRIRPKTMTKNCKIKNIALCSFYYRGPKSTAKKELFDHIATTYHFLCAKYGSGLDFILAADSNRLNLAPILNLSSDLKQVVNVPTRLNPDRILDPIMTSLSRYYKVPVTKPPLEVDSDKKGVASDHLIVLMEPVTSTQQVLHRTYRTIERRPINAAGLKRFSEWVGSCSWSNVYLCPDPNEKAAVFQRSVFDKYIECFPAKRFKVAEDDQPWFTSELKQLDRQRKREYYRHQKSDKWIKLNATFLEKCKKAKEKYHNNTIIDLKESKPGQWHSKLKRISGQETDKYSNVAIDALKDITDEEQAKLIADHYAKIANEYEPIDKDQFPDYKGPFTPPTIFPWDVLRVMNSLNKKASTVPGDIPIKLMLDFSVELATPLAHIFNSCLQDGIYPNIFKVENVTPAPKKNPSKELSDLRKISGLLNSAKIFDKILSEYIICDMKASRDPAQFGNEKKVSTQHYLIRMLNRIITAVDINARYQAYAVILQMIDWSQAFDRQCHTLGIKSFIENGVRPSIIPVMISYFENRSMKVKWKGCFSSVRKMNGGGAQGSLPGTLEYLSQNNSCGQFLSQQDRYKFIDDLSLLEIVNLINVGLASYNFKMHISDKIKSDHLYLPPMNIESQNNLNEIEQWTENNKMKLNIKKSNYMIFNFTNDHQFSTRLEISGNPVEEVSNTRLLGVQIDSSLSWQSNTDLIVRKAYRRMIMLHKLYSFAVPVADLVEIYILYIRSILENSAVVWHSALTIGQELELERVQKVALRIILKDKYVTYGTALKLCSLQTLKDRRRQLCLTFARKCVKSGKNDDIFPRRKHVRNTRNPEKFTVTHARTDRLKYSAVPYMQRLLNKYGC